MLTSGTRYRHWCSCTWLVLLILHSPQDEVVPWGDSAELIEQWGLSPDVLISVGDDHRLGDEASLEVLP